MTSFSSVRLSALRTVSPGSAGSVEGLTRLTVTGLSRMYLAPERRFVRTSRRAGAGLTQEGTSLRYAAIAALGLNLTTDEDQRRVLHGGTAPELAAAVLDEAASARDPGAIGLAAWAGAEVLGVGAAGLFHRIAAGLRSGAPLPTVDCAWILTAALAAPSSATTDAVIGLAADRLLGAQAAGGLFPHALPARSLGPLRAHVGCFADQVYPIQALARLALATGRADALGAANRCAAQICRLQGPAGQWWWHYDVRTDRIVERFPVYSVHQHAMGPMALFDLWECGGDDHRAAVGRGVDWLTTHPETSEQLVDEERGVVWRKVGRREPAKLVRRLSAVLTAAVPRAGLPGADLVFPAGVVDHECRPYELGWLLYAWQGRQVAHRPDLPRDAVGR